MEDNTFITNTNHSANKKKYILTFVITYIVMAVVVAIFLFKIISALIYVEALVLICTIFCAFLALKNNGKYEFIFTDNNLKIIGVNARQNWAFFDLPTSDFILSQTEKQKQKNCGNMKIKNTPFKFYFVENFSEMQNYINQNFK